MCLLRDKILRRRLSVLGPILSDFSTPSEYLLW